MFATSQCRRITLTKGLEANAACIIACILNPTLYKGCRWCQTLHLGFLISSRCHCKGITALISRKWMRKKVSLLTFQYITALLTWREKVNLFTCLANAEDKRKKRWRYGLVQPLYKEYSKGKLMVLLCLMRLGKVQHLYQTKQIKSISIGITMSA